MLGLVSQPPACLSRAGLYYQDPAHKFWGFPDGNCSTYAREASRKGGHGAAAWSAGAVGSPWTGSWQLHTFLPSPEHQAQLESFSGIFVTQVIVFPSQKVAQEQRDTVSLCQTFQA